MKKLVLSLFLVSATVSLFGQLTTQNDAKKIHEKKMIIALKSYPKKATPSEKANIDIQNRSLEFAMRNFWDFSKVDTAMYLNDAKKFVKNHNDYCYASIIQTYSHSGTYNSTYRYVAIGENLGIFDGKLQASSYIPYYEDSLTRTVAAYASMQLSRFLENLYVGNYKSMLGSTKHIKQNSSKIIEKTLLIPREYLSPKLSEDDVKLFYPYKIDFCDLNKIENAILERDPAYAVLFYVPFPMNGKFQQNIFVSNPEDGEIYGMIGFDTFQLNLRVIGDLTGWDKRKFLVNEKQLKQLAKLVD